MSHPDFHKVRRDLTGQTFGFLSIVEFAGFNQRWQSRWTVQCECGTTKIISGTTLVSGKAKSCGCKKSFMCSLTNLKHGMSRHGKETSEYLIWSAMKRRCYNPQDPAYVNYGGRGIKVCEQWKNSFENFYADMGSRPTSRHSIERDDNNGNYEPNNVRWATYEEQANNKRNSLVVDFRGEKMTLSQAVRAAGNVVGITTANGRYHDGWPVEDAVTAPAQRSGYKKRVGGKND